MVQITASRLQLLIANPVGGAIFISGPKIGLKSTKIVVFCILFRLMEGARIPPLAMLLPLIPNWWYAKVFQVVRELIIF